MVKDVTTLKYLRGLDSGEKLDPRDKIKATAARVGLGVPKVNFFCNFFFFFSNNSQKFSIVYR